MVIIAVSIVWPASYTCFEKSSVPAPKCAFILSQTDNNICVTRSSEQGAMRGLSLRQF